MATIQGGVSGLLSDVGLAAALAMHVTGKPIPHGSLGHYRCVHRCALVATQAANSRLFEVRNTHATNLVIPLSLETRWLQTAAHTAAIEDSLDFFKVTTFSAVDTTNTVTPTASQLRGTMAAPPGAAAIRGLTIAGVAAGMTGGTLTKDGGAFSSLPHWLMLAQPTSPNIDPQYSDPFLKKPDVSNFIFVQNEGFIVENRVLLGAAAGSVVYFDFSWVEVTLY